LHDLLNQLDTASMVTIC